MKRICSKMTPALLLLCFIFFASSSAIAQYKYTITDLGTLGGTQAFAYAINDPGQIVGYSWMPGDAGGNSFLYQKGEMTDLYPLNSQDLLTGGPTSINNLGKIASGVIVEGIYVPAIYDSKTGKITTLGSLGGLTSYGFNGVATSINNYGQVVGYSYLDNINRHAFLYENGVMSDIDPFGGYSGALDINDSGMIVGFASDHYSGRAHAFLYGNGVMLDLDPFGDSGFTWSESYARGINNWGQVVGNFLTEDKTAFHCFIYSDGEMTDFGTLGGPDCVPYAINERGEVVGTSLFQVGDAYSWHGFLYKNGAMTDLNTLIPVDSGWELSWAFDINNSGQIVGYGIVKNVEGVFRPFLLTPMNPLYNTTEFVKQQYRDFLNREAEPGGLQFWVNHIDSGAMTKAQVIDAFLHSQEFEGRIAPIVRLYFAYFLRIPDYGGLQYWISQYMNGMSLGSISDGFAASQEFQQRYGTLSNEQFVTLVYQNVLGRSPDPGGYAYWVGQLSSGAMTRGQVIVGFSESEEYKGLTSHEVFVTMMYIGMLRRSPEEGGFNFWVNYLDSGNSGLALIDGFLHSTEYADRF